MNYTKIKDLLSEITNEFRGAGSDVKYLSEQLIEARLELAKTLVLLQKTTAVLKRGPVTIDIVDSIAKSTKKQVYDFTCDRYATPRQFINEEGIIDEAKVNAEAQARRNAKADAKAKIKAKADAKARAEAKAKADASPMLTVKISEVPGAVRELNVPKADKLSAKTLLELADIDSRNVESGRSKMMVFGSEKQLNKAIDLSYIPAANCTIVVSMKVKGNP